MDDYFAMGKIDFYAPNAVCLEDGMPSNRNFSFISRAYPGDTFSVLTFEVEEGLNQLYRGKLLLAAKDPNIDFNDILESSVICVVHGPDKDLPVYGMVSKFEQLHMFEGLAFYRVEVSPKLWLLTRMQTNQVFLNMSIPQILEQILQQGGLTQSDYSIKLQHDYPVREIVCQYNESHYDFLMRWMERYGMYYYFERNENRAVMVITDTVIAHPDLRRHKEVRYVPPSGLRTGSDPEVLHSIVRAQQPTTQNVKIKDFNYQTPALSITSQHSVSGSSLGEYYEFGDNVLTTSEGDHLSSIMAEAIQANTVRYYGESSLRPIRGGYIMTVTGHFREEYNRDYLVVSCRHRGSQVSFLDAGLRKKISGIIEKWPEYENKFTAIPADVQFRPLRTVRKARISGTLTAVIDAEGSGQYAELDSQGRYKVILPYDLSGRKDGNASCWIRMMQPYGGPDHGLHLPLHKGTEVLLTFEAGDPDRPVIAGAVPNPLNPSVIKNTDQTMCKLTTSGQNKIHIQDTQGQQNILLSSPTHNTWLSLGASNNTPTSGEGNSNDTDQGDSGWAEPSKDTGGFRWSTSGNWYGVIGQDFSIKVGGNSTSVIVGGSESLYLGVQNLTVLGARTTIVVGADFNFTFAKNFFCDFTSKTIFRPMCFKTEAERVDVVELKTTVNSVNNSVSEVKTSLAEECNKISMQDTTISEMAEQLVEMKNELTGMKTSIAETETKLRTEVVSLAESKMQIAESSVQMLTEQVSVLSEDLKTATSETKMLSESVQVLGSLIIA